MYRSTELFFKPEENCRQYTNNLAGIYSEMTSFEQAFLCGILREKRPKKIVEIGVAAGGTTAVMLEAIKLLDLETEIYSVDLAEQWYRTGKKPTGFLITEFYGDYEKHSLMLGKSIPHVIEEIGAGIDMLILDTTHCLPGELLDFIICYPFLDRNCTVILHDIAENLLTGRDNDIATKLLFDVIKADKWYMHDTERNLYGQSNIAAFQMNEKTKESIEDLFSGLSMTWQYHFKDEEEKAYLRIIEKYHGAERKNALENILHAQRYVYLKKMIASHYRLDDEWLKMKWAHEKKDVYLYGAGFWAEQYIKYAKHNDLPIRGMVVSDDQDTGPEENGKFPVVHLNSLQAVPEQCVFILALDHKHFSQIKRNMSAKGYYNYM